MGFDSAAAADRVRPGPPGSGVKFSFTSSASAFQQIPNRTKTANQQGSCQYISVKATVACHLVFGDDDVGAPTNADMLLEPTDGWQDMMLISSDTGFRVKGDATSGDLYIWFSGH